MKAKCKAKRITIGRCIFPGTIIYTDMARGLRLIRQQQIVRRSIGVHPRFDYRHYQYCVSMGGIQD